MDWVKDWAPVISAGVTLVLAIVAVWAVLKPIEENRRLREEEKKSSSKKRQLDDVQEWTTEILKFKHVYAGPLAPNIDVRLREPQLGALIASKEYIKLQAKLLDADLNNLPVLREKHKDRLEDAVGRLSVILEFGGEQGLYANNKGLKQEVEQKCVAILSTISDLRAELQL